MTITPPYIRSGDPGMALPDGQTCSDCGHIARCRWLIDRRGHETECDWSPSRFAWPIPKAVEVKP